MSVLTADQLLPLSAQSEQIVGYRLQLKSLGPVRAVLVALVITLNSEARHAGDSDPSSRWGTGPG